MRKDLLYMHMIKIFIISEILEMLKGSNKRMHDDRIDVYVEHTHTHTKVEDEKRRKIFRK